ncbi:sulfurtransferase [Paenarthrobacter sp. NPDC018779]|uniref:sulfurtransferase n=1 Tax=Paenarthrobacter sp. NPDC018779 TaxID=3364375 RepID=UPI0037C4F05E
MTNTSRIPPFVSLDWCEDHRSNLVLADTRWYLDGSSGRQAYDQGHLPGAVFVDLDAWLSGDSGDVVGRNPLPDPEVFSAGMSSLGIGDSDVVVAYDDAGGVIAARLVWMLRVTGRQAAILDGGLASYRGPLESSPVAKEVADFGVRPWPTERLAGLEDVLRGDATVADARNRDRFEGLQDPVDPRPGHIPGAINLPCRENLDAGGRLLADDELRRNVRAAGIRSADRFISYCGSGVTACHNLLTLEHLGLGEGRLFVGGWSQYSRSPDLPVELGPAGNVA